MSENLTQLYTQQYSSNVALLLQEQGYKLRGLVTSGSHVGNQASPVNQIGAVSMRPILGRFQPKTQTHATNQRRWVYPTDLVLDQPVDSFDELKTIVDVKSPYAANASLAAGRAMDDEIIAAAFADAKIGVNGGSTETFDTSTYAVAANESASSDVGLTVQKLIKADQIFREANVDLDMETKTLVIAPLQHADMLGQSQVVSTDFNSRPVLVDGKLTMFLGYNIVVSNRLDVINTDERACIAFVKSGLYLGIWKDVNSDAHQRYDMEGNPWELTTTMSIGATRLEQGRVIRIAAQE